MVMLCNHLPIALFFQMNGFPPAHAAEDIVFGICHWQAPTRRPHHYP
jgi:hypothetical protein